MTVTSIASPNPIRPMSSGAGVYADADFERPTDFALEPRVQEVEREVDGARGAQRLPTADLDPEALAEDGDQAVADEAVDAAALGVDRGADGAEEFVEQKHDVERQLLRGNRRVAAHVDVEHRERLFDAVAVGLVEIHRLRPGTDRAQQPQNS